MGPPQFFEYLIQTFSMAPDDFPVPAETVLLFAVIYIQIIDAGCIMELFPLPPTASNLLE